MSRAVRQPFPLLAWAVVPALFTAAVLGLTSLGEILLSQPSDIVLTSAHLGAAAGVTLIVGLARPWPRRLRAVRWVYPVVIFVVGVVVHGTDVPTVVALTTGLPSVAILARMRYLRRFPRILDQENRKPDLVGAAR
ncbi:hypothetical protein [Actinocrispum wychmicini]|uniref:hypothetical protein n=1 Tax=Actinocrispum wychmicini TaxID=1213861 RepID=UPI0010477146|nr:hypothetical protein [Actinocrispum wychmicini]